MQFFKLKIWTNDTMIRWTLHLIPNTKCSFLTLVLAYCKSSFNFLLELETHIHYITFLLNRSQTWWRENELKQNFWWEENEFRLFSRINKFSVFIFFISFYFTFLMNIFDKNWNALVKIIISFISSKILLTSLRNWNFIRF